VPFWLARGTANDNGNTGMIENISNKITKPKENLILIYYA
jgi:hypothetical protein